MREDIMALKKDIKELKDMNNNFDLGDIFRKIIYFLCVIIIILLGVILFLTIKNNDMAKELSQFTCETDIMEQDGLYNFIDSEGNMITTDTEVLEKFIEEYYNGKAEKGN